MANETMTGVVPVEGAASPAREISSAVFHWATGTRGTGQGRVLFGETREHLHELTRLSARGDAVLIPAAAEPGAEDLSSGARLLTYQGALTEPGDLMHIGRGYEIEMQDYLSLPFLPITRPMVVRCLSERSWDAFIADADEARSTGRFIPQLAGSSVALADRAVIEATVDRSPVAVTGLTVDRDGEARYGAAAPSVGSVADLHALATELDALTFLDGVGGRRIEGRLAERGWLRAYLTALRVVGREGGETWRISGFGGTLTGEDPAPDALRTDNLVIWRDDDHQFVVGGSGRRFALGRDTAIVVEILLASSSLDAARSAIVAAGLDRVGLDQDIADLLRRFADRGVTISPGAVTA